MTADEIAYQIDNRSNNLTIEDLRIINAAMKRRWDSITRNTALSLSVGDKVKFNAKGLSHKGVVKKVNSKTIKVHTDDGKNWTVSPGLISRI